MIHRIVIFLAIASLVLSSSVSLAQAAGATGPFAPQGTTQPSSPITAGSEGLASCFDYYQFDSVPVIVTPDVSTASQGATIHFTGTVTNKNAYPLQNLNVYVKIFHRADSAKSSFGPDVVDSFVAEKGILLKGNGSQPVSFEWKVPKDAAPGNYSAAIYVASDDRFEMQGLSFTNDIVGATSNFAVDGSNTGGSHFDVSHIYLNGEQFHTTAFPPTIAPATTGVPITARIQNSSQPFTGTIDWKVYKWDGLQQGALLAHETDKISIGANASTTVRYVVRDESHTVYYVVGELIPDDAAAAHSFITLRYVLSGINEPRIAFAGVNAYPAQSGNTVFACVHSTGIQSADQVKLDVSVVPANPLLRLLPFTTLVSKTYTGAVSTQVAALTIPLSKSLGSSFVVNAKLYQSNKLIDTVSIPYVCDALGGQNCIWGDYGIYLVILLVLVLVIGGGMFFMRNSRKPKEEINNPTI